LDLRDIPTEVVFAWMRYLYTQEDLSLLWPCSGAGLAAEDADAAVLFWTELLRLAQRIGDWRMELYAQDTLVGALTAQNWYQLSVFAEQVKCRALSEASLMTGVRRLTPGLLRSFKVPTGLEDPASQKVKDATSTMTATVGAVTSGLASRIGAQHGQVEMEIERRLLTSHAKERQPAALMDLKRSSPAQFTELKIRLVEGIKSQQQVAEQLQRAASFFQSPDRESSLDDRIGRRSWWLELLGMVVGLTLVCVPWLRQGMFDLLRPLWSLLPVAEDVLGPILGSGLVLTPGVATLVCVNSIMIVVLILMVWSSLKA